MWVGELRQLEVANSWKGFAVCLFDPPGLIMPDDGPRFVVCPFLHPAMPCLPLELEFASESFVLATYSFHQPPLYH